MIQGQCHCGNVKLSIAALSAHATQCTCSICSRYAALWGYFTQREVQLNVGEHGVASYCHGDKQIHFHHCARCACITHYTTAQASPKARFAVNYRMFAPSVLQELRVRTFDGANTWQYLD